MATATPTYRTEKVAKPVKYEEKKVLNGITLELSAEEAQGLRNLVGSLTFPVEQRFGMDGSIHRALAKAGIQRNVPLSLIIGVVSE